MLFKDSHSMQTRPEPSAVAQAQETSSSVSPRWKWVLYVAVGIGIVLALKYFHVQDLLKAALDWIGKLGPWGPVIFIGLYVVATVLFIPGSVLTLGAGAVFGVALGAVHGEFVVRVPLELDRPLLALMVLPGKVIDMKCLLRPILRLLAGLTILLGTLGIEPFSRRTSYPN